MTIMDEAQPNPAKRKSPNTKGLNQYNMKRLHGPPVATEKQKAQAARATAALIKIRAERRAAKGEMGLLPKAFEGDLTLKQRRFLAGYALRGSIRGAMDASNVDSRWHYHWLATVNDYSCAFQRAKDIYSDVAEGEIRGRGIAGWKKPLHYKGKLTGDVVTEYSDALALAVIKALKPEYRDGQQIAIGPAKISIEISSPAADQAKDVTEVTIAPAGDEGE
jgi:hypothetical protein